jgi:dCTP deaminase
MTFWSDETWRAIGDADAPVEPFNRDRLEEAKYIMAVGEEVYISSSAPMNTIRKLSPDEAFQLGPGQFAYILTHEIVRMPFDAIGFISINATVKFAGLVNISGFHVDPGYKGRLLFSVFNAGPTSIHLRRGQPIFPLWIANLDKPIRNTEPKIGYDKIDPKLITAISGNYTTAFELNEIIRYLRIEVDETKLKVTTLEATRLQLIVLIAVLGFLFGGMVTAGTKMVFDWVIVGARTTESRPITPAILPASPPPASAPARP